MYKHLFFIICCLGAITVALGAFGAHGLKTRADVATIAIFETAVKYQFYHVFALLVVALLAQKKAIKFLEYAAYSFLIGIVLFSGSLYVLTYCKAMGYTQYSWLGAVTPFGGVAFIIGWILLAFSGKKLS